MPQLHEADNRIRIPPFIWKQFCKRAWADGKDPREYIKELAIDYAFGHDAIREAIPQRTPKAVIEQERKKFDTPDQFINELLDTNELFNWD